MRSGDRRQSSGHFRCSVCKQRAEMVDDTDTNKLTRVSCLTCNVEVTGADAQVMYEELRSRFVEQTARQVSRESLRESGLRVPLSKVDDEFGDSAYPFVLTLKTDTK